MADKKSAIENAIIAESIRITGMPNVGREFRLWQDLKLEGEDAYELLNILEKKFNVDLARFRMDDYFPGEGFSLSGFFAWVLRSPKKQRKELTVLDLAEFILKNSQGTGIS